MGRTRSKVQGGLEQQSAQEPSNEDGLGFPTGHRLEVQATTRGANGSGYKALHVLTVPTKASGDGEGPWLRPAPLHRPKGQSPTGFWEAGSWLAKWWDDSKVLAQACALSISSGPCAASLGREQERRAGRAEASNARAGR